MTPELSVVVFRFGFVHLVGPNISHASLDLALALALGEADQIQSLLTNNVVFNEDDCVAITSGQFITVGNFFCDGSHGLSIGSVGGKSNNTVADILFRDSTVQNAQNGARIKTNSGTTGSITRVTYDNIQVSNISIYGVSRIGSVRRSSPFDCFTPI